MEGGPLLAMMLLQEGLQSCCVGGVLPRAFADAGGIEGLSLWRFCGLGELVKVRFVSGGM